jgi:hypothetical protein
MGNLRQKYTTEEWDMLVEIAKARLADQVDDMNGDKDNKVTRLEVINHGENERPVGRLLTLYKELGDFNNIELSYQDDGKTLKIFIR